MVTYMNDKKIQTLDDIRAFLKGTTEIEFSIEGKDERYQWIRQTLVRFQYLSLNQRERGVVLRYLERVSGYSRQTVTRLVAQYRKTGKVQRRQRTVAGFQCYYTRQDALLLAELDELHGTPCGAAAKKRCERMYHIHGDARFEQLSHISVSHLYNLRHSTGYQRQRRQFDKTRPTRSQIGERRKPNPQGQPGYLRGLSPNPRKSTSRVARYAWSPQRVKSIAPLRMKRSRYSDWLSRHKSRSSP